MAEELLIPETNNKEKKYQALLPQLSALIETETDLIANLANIAAALKQAMGFFWAGFYLNKNNELVLGPFQGPIACTRIPIGKGVCGTALLTKKTIVVPDVNQFPGHIACSSQSKSEIVVPLIVNGEAVLVLDVDSDKIDDFDMTDSFWLGKIAGLMARHFEHKQ